MSEPSPTDKTVCNLQVALKRLGGSHTLLNEMIEFYLQDYRLLVEKIESAAEAGNPNDLLRNAHSLKGLAANFDGTEVVDAVSAVTRASRAGFGRAPHGEIAALAAAAETLAQHLEAAREADERETDERD